MEIPLIHRRESLIIATIEIIDELGIQGLTTKEIAKRQGVSEATLFRHFKSKDDLLLAVLDHFSQYDSDIFSSVKIKKMKPKKAVIYFVEAYATYYENYPAITAITQAYDVLRYDPELADKVINIFENRTEAMRKMIEEAQKAGVIRKEADSENLADIITSTCNGICLKWRMNAYNFSLCKKTLSAVNMLLDAFS